MKESIGSTASLNIVLVFLAVVFAFIAASLSYYKAFKVNNIIVNSIEKYEGFNDKAIAEIDVKLDSIGYKRINLSCSNEPILYNKRYYNLVDKESGKGICIYFNQNQENKTYSYLVVTFMTIDLPVIKNFMNFPIKTVTNEMYGCYGKNQSYGVHEWQTECN